MGNFNEYPYINYNDFNFDWILKTVKKLVNDWKSYNDTWDSWQEDIERDFTDLRNYVQNYFDNLDIETEVREQVSRVVQEILTDDYIRSILNNYIAQMPRTIKGDLALNLYQTAPYQCDGMVYIGNNRVVVYFSRNTSDTGLLECYDLKEKTRLWSYPIEGYHGNSITHYNNEIYITAAFSVNDQATLIPTIVVVSLDNPSVVNRVITPAVSGLYSCIYGNGNFYGITHRGTTEGEANLCTVFDTDFNIVRTMILPDYPAINGFSTQGIQCYYNNVIYGVDYTNAAIFGYDATTGEKVFQANVEEYFNNYRYVGEIESITYDYDNNDFYIDCRFVGGGESGTRLGSIVKIGMYNDILAKRVLPLNTNIQTGISATSRINVNFRSQTLRPSQTADFYNLADAINLSKNTKQESNIVIYTDENFAGLSVFLRGFSGALIGVSPTNKLKVVNLSCEACEKVLFQNMSFDGTNTIETYWGTYTGVGVLSRSNVTFLSCEALNNSLFNQINSNVYDIDNTNLTFRADGRDCLYERRIANLNYEVTANAYTKIKSRLFATQSLTVNRTINTKIKGNSLVQLALNNIVKAWKVASNVFTPLTVSFNSSSNTLILSDGSNTATLSIDSSTGIITVTAITGSAMTVTLDLA